MDHGEEAPVERADRDDELSRIAERRVEQPAEGLVGVERNLLGRIAEEGGERAARDGLLLMHRDALYEAGPSPLQLAWSDAGCSERFYDYGSERMAEVVAAEPEKAARWRTAELEAAWSIADLRAAVEHGMELEAEEAPEEAMEEAWEEAMEERGELRLSVVPSLIDAVRLPWSM